jgi:hypothetical protein
MRSKQEPDCFVASLLAMTVNAAKARMAGTQAERSDTVLRTAMPGHGEHGFSL